MLEFGACDAHHTKQFLQILDGLERPFALHSFEPEPENFARCQLLHYVGNVGRYSLWPLAVGAEVGVQPFYVSSGVRIEAGRVVENYYGSSSIREPKLATAAWPGMIFTPSTTQVTTLDTFAREHVGGVIDFIWADIQGAEVDLIRGGAETWKRVRYLYTEYGEREYYKGEIGLAEIRALLPDFDLIEDYGNDVLLHNRNLT